MMADGYPVPKAMDGMAAFALPNGNRGQCLRGISPSGELFDFARNIHSTVEFAGACFSPDGQTSFVNMYGRPSVRTVQPTEPRCRFP
jgi:secreted PhoX family phosphatase